ncbi:MULTISPECIES: hypothetical protein [unclassified Streptomyces]|nr:MULTISPECIES: hypothetical protein [unclassified Streptomyces]WPO74718.1 hypothetical protein R9806_30935 [Streptomyces sp. KN37]
MRRVTTHKPVGKSVSRRVRERQEAEVQPRERPEVRKDVQRTWWPEG